MVTFAAAARAEPVTGRVYVAISRTNDRDPDPADRHHRRAAVRGERRVAGAGGRRAVRRRRPGYPVKSLRDCPAATTGAAVRQRLHEVRARRRPHRVAAHGSVGGAELETIARQHRGDAGADSLRPGVVHADSARGGCRDSAHRAAARHGVVKFEDPERDPDEVVGTSDLSRRHRPVAGRLCRTSDVEYPVVYNHGHFPPRRLAGSAAARRTSSHWLAGRTPRVIDVWMQHPSPYYDDSYGVNSQNNGPFGDAIMQELIPLVETEFRVIREPWARMLTGGSTGGWIALAHQVFYPDFYGGVFSLCPDGVDFRYHQIVNIYSDDNAYFIDRGWVRTERPNKRRPDGNIQSMMKDENWYELVQWRPIAIGRSVGHLGSDVRTGRRRWLSAADLGQDDRQDRQEGRRRTGRSTTTSATFWSRAGRRSVPRSRTRSTSTSATPTATS